MSRLAEEYLTTRELAELLHIKERKVYDLVASGEVPCSRATGKLLFPRAAINQWVTGNITGTAQTPADATHSARPNVVLGSHEPLLEWALRESGAGIATFFDGSLDGLQRYKNAEGIAAGLHCFAVEENSWNSQLISQQFAGDAVVLVEFAWRDRGLIVARGNPAGIGEISQLQHHRLVPRQPNAGSQILLLQLLNQAGIDASHLRWIDTARSETDAALAVQEDYADAALGLRSPARQFNLGFVPLLRERFDLLIDRRAWFEPPMQNFVRFCNSAAFKQKAEELSGYDVGGFGQIHFNGM